MAEVLQRPNETCRSAGGQDRLTKTPLTPAGKGARGTGQETERAGSDICDQQRHVSHSTAARRRKPIHGDPCGGCGHAYGAAERSRDA